MTVFADPMCDVLDSLTNPKNKSHIPISGKLEFHIFDTVAYRSLVIGLKPK